MLYDEIYHWKWFKRITCQAMTAALFRGCTQQSIDDPRSRDVLWLERKHGPVSNIEKPLHPSLRVRLGMPL